LRQDLKDIDVAPVGGADAGEKVLQVGNPMISRLVKEGLDREAVRELEDCIAITVMQCAIAYANGTNKWARAISLLEEARGLAHNAEVIQRIDENLATGRRNHQLFGDLEMISSAPPLWTFNGFGFTVYGDTDHSPISGSYMTTYYFVALMIPLFPICRYRVISSGNSYRFLGKASLRTFDKCHLAVSVVGILMLLLFIH
jgi:hypothetical protein